MKGVYDPQEDPGAGLYPGWVPFPKGGEFLEMGCGVGLVSVAAARAGCRRVTALDVDPEAVRNVALNAHLHGVLESVRAQRSDLFSALGPDERFDTIFWNPPYLNPPSDRAGGDAHAAFYDPDYSIIRRFVESAPAHLAPGGRILLGFGSDGDVELLKRIADKAGARLEVVAEAVREYETSRRGVSISYWLIEVATA
nr:methyltransferase [Nocardiopsis mwathae]